MSAPCIGWEFDFSLPSIQEKWATFDSELQEAAMQDAAAWLGALTAHAYGGCPIVVRPCARRCAPTAWWGDDGRFRPFILNGEWVNSCGCTDDCGCGPLSRIDLGRAGSVSAVTIDGEILPTSGYRIDDGRWLVRTDGDSWPACQDLSVDSGVGTFLVAFTAGLPLDPTGKRCGAMLAMEFAKLLADEDCRLPDRIKTLRRQGVEQELTKMDMTQTGIGYIDRWLYSVNPHRRTQTSRVWWPGKDRATATTFGGGA